MEWNILAIDRNELTTENMMYIAQGVYISLHPWLNWNSFIDVVWFCKNSHIESLK